MMVNLRQWLPFFRSLDTLERFDHPTSYPRYIRNCARDRRWKGPSYLTSRRWRHDLLLVLEHIRLSVRTNAALSPAFDAAVQDYLALAQRWSAERIGRLCKVTGLAVLVLLAALSAIVDVSEEGVDALPSFAQPAILGLWLFFVFRRDRYKPAAVFASLKIHIDSGHTLSEAMARLPRFFPKNLVTMVEVGEQTGQLDEIFDRFSNEALMVWSARRELRQLFWYFAIGIIVQFAIISFLMIKVVPVFYDIFAEFDIDATRHSPAPGMLIPLPSMNFIVVLTDLMAYQTSALLSLAGGLITIWLIYRKKVQRRSWASRTLSTLLLALPGMRGMIARQNLASAAYSLNLMLTAGIPLERALENVANGDLHWFYRRWFAKVRTRVIAGESLRNACNRSRLVPVPRSFVSLMAMGETHGRLEDALAYIAEQYHASVERKKRLLMGSMLPLGVFVMGYIALSFEASMFYMLTALADAMVP